MSVFFSSEPEPDDSQLAELWNLLEDEHFDDAANLGESMCEDADAPVEYFCGFSLALGEIGYDTDAEELARTAIGFGEGSWHARHALSVTLMHQGRFLGALDSLGFHRTPDEIYVIRAQIERMGGYSASLLITLEDALQKNLPPPIQLYVAYLHHTVARGLSDWGDLDESAAQVFQYGAYLDVWERDAVRHHQSPYGKQLVQHIAAIRQLLD